MKQTATIRSSTKVFGLSFTQRLRSAVESYPTSRSKKGVFATAARRPKSDSFHSLPAVSQVKRIRAGKGKGKVHPRTCYEGPEGE